MRVSLLILAALALAFPQAQAQTAELSSPSQPAAKRAASTFAPSWNPYRGGPSVLFDQLQLVTSPGTGSDGADESVLQSTSLGMTTLGAGQQLTGGNFIADDFVVPVGEEWTVTEMNFYGYQTNAIPDVSTFTDYVVQIWDGSPDNPASSVIAGDLTTNVLTRSVFSNIYRVTETTLGAANRPIFTNTVTLTAPVVLAPGTYWVQWAAAGTLASGPWQPPVTISGETTTGNALQLTGGAWNAFVDGGIFTPQGAPFQVLGTSAAATGPILIVSSTGIDFGSVDAGGSATQTVTLTSGGSEAIVISSIAITGSPEFTVDQSGTSLTLAPGASTTFDITFAPTALGAFAANVEISSNDPDGQIVIAVTGSSDVTTELFSGDTTGEPVFARPDDLGDGTSGSCTVSTSGSAVAYEATAFTVSGDGDYDVRADWTAGQDGFLLLYQGDSFDPADPCVGLIGFDDDEVSIAASLISDVTLSAGTVYTVVATGFDNVAFGTYDISISGPGTAALTTAGEETATFASDLSVTPNPSSTRSVVRLEVAETQATTVAVFDATGRRVAVLHDGIAVAGQLMELELDAASLPSGVYVIRALSGSDALSQRVTVIR